MIHGQGLASLQSMYSSEMQMAAGHGMMGTGLPMPAQGNVIVVIYPSFLRRDICVMGACTILVLQNEHRCVKKIY